MAAGGTKPGWNWLDPLAPSSSQRDPSHVSTQEASCWCYFFSHKVLMGRMLSKVSQPHGLQLRLPPSLHQQLAVAFCRTNIPQTPNEMNTHPTPLFGGQYMINQGNVSKRSAPCLKKPRFRSFADTSLRHIDPMIHHVFWRFLLHT